MRPRLLLAVCCVFLAGAAAVATPTPTRIPDTHGWPPLDAYAGKVVLVDFWASWCAPCLRSFPWMNELQRRHGDAGLVVVAVNLDQERRLADAFLSKTPANFRLEFDAAGEVARRFGVQSMPTSFLIDRSGNVRARHAGFRDAQRQEREREIVELLEETN